MSKRNYRLAGEIKRDLTDIFAHEIRDPHIDSMVSVTDVEVSNDLSYARIYVSKLGSQRDREKLLEALEKANGYIRTLLSQRLKIRKVPELRFFLDDSLEYGAKIDKILGELGE
ncbi:MAG: 30S ribosome-binding factor RbfA [Peptococcaceae bacterium]|nr:30S ribosome-binding factor RbfA [Peptococcaceae bacterium]